MSFSWTYLLQAGMVILAALLVGRLAGGVIQRTLRGRD